MANPKVQDILTKLQTAPTYRPANISGFTDWALEAGDVITVKQGDESYKIPVFSQTLNWAGATQSSIEATGKKKRDSIAKAQEAKSSGVNFNDDSETYGGVTFDSVGSTYTRHGGEHGMPTYYTTTATANVNSLAGTTMDHVEGNIVCTDLFNKIYGEGKTSGWNLAEGTVHNPSVIPSDTQQTTFTMIVPNEDFNTAKTITFTIKKGTPDSGGGYVSVSDGNGVVGRIDISNWWTAAYEAGWKDAAECLQFGNQSNNLQIKAPSATTVGQTDVFGYVQPYTNSQSSSRPSPESVTVTSIAKLRYRKKSVSTWTYGQQRDEYSKTYDI